MLAELKEFLEAALSDFNSDALQLEDSKKQQPTTAPQQRQRPKPLWRFSSETTASCSSSASSSCCSPAEPDEKVISALDFVQQAIRSQKDKRESAEFLLFHANKIAVARLAARNRLGAKISLKEILRHQAQINQLNHSIERLEKLLTVAEFESFLPTPIDFHARVSEVLSAAAPLEKTQVIKDDEDVFQQVAAVTGEESMT